MVREMVNVAARTISGRMLLLRALRPAGPVLITLICVMLFFAALVPAATAVTVAFLVDGVAAAAAERSSAVVLFPLLTFAVVLGISHVMDAAEEPLYYLARTRIDGAHRRALTELAGSGPTIGGLESPEIQRLVKEAKADPDNWTQRTPADGALCQLAVLVAFLGLVASSVVLARYAWWLVPLLVVPALVHRMLERRRSIAWYRQWQRGMDEGRHAEKWEPAVVSASEGKDARVFGFGDWVVARMQRHTRAMFEPVWALGGRQIAQQAAALPVIVVPLAIAYIAVARGAADGQVSVPLATAVLTAAWSVFQVLVHNDVRDPIGAVACLRATEKLQEALAPAAPPRAQVTSRAAPAAADEPAAGPPLVRFEDVSFTYPRTRRVVLDGLDLEIRPGELLGVVGLNGAGKSTLIKLLAGLYQPTSGRITVDGVDLREMDTGAWRERLSVVFQDFVRYPLPVEDNVRLGRATVPFDPAAMAAATRDAGLNTVVAALPKTWQTPLSRTRTDGVDLSGGQWQQVVLARALYAVRTGAQLLVLDEPTAHLDVRTEFEVFDRLAASKGDASVVLISHRLSTVRPADQIALLEGGRITEYGSHERLMTLGGSYARLFSIQAERFSQGFDDRIEEGELL